MKGLVVNGGPGIQGKDGRPPSRTFQAEPRAWRRTEDGSAQLRGLRWKKPQPGSAGLGAGRGSRREGPNRPGKGRAEVTGTPSSGAENRGAERGSAAEPTTVSCLSRSPSFANV